MIPWLHSMSVAAKTGAQYSGAASLYPSGLCNRVGQIYTGPCVLVTNARCYSAADGFAASFQDHEIGPVLGTDPHTGGMGANVWKLEEIMEGLKSGPMPTDQQDWPLGYPPANVNLRVSFRRMVRSGKNANLELEAIGVIPDHLHDMTRNDLLNANADLIEHAGQLLAAMPAYKVDASADRTKRGLSIKVACENVDRLDIYIDDRPFATHDVTNGHHGFLVQAPALAKNLSLRGFAKDKLVINRQVDLWASSGGHLCESTHFFLNANLQRVGAAVFLKLNTLNIDAIDVQCNDESVGLFPVQDGENHVAALLPVDDVIPSWSAGQLTVIGLSKGRAVAADLSLSLKGSESSAQTLEASKQLAAQVQKSGSAFKTDLQTSGIDSVKLQLDCLDPCEKDICEPITSVCFESPFRFNGNENLYVYAYSESKLVAATCVANPEFIHLNTGFVSKPGMQLLADVKRISKGFRLEFTTKGLDKLVLRWSDNQSEEIQVDSGHFVIERPEPFTVYTIDILGYCGKDLVAYGGSFGLDVRFMTPLQADVFGQDGQLTVTVRGPSITGLLLRVEFEPEVFVKVDALPGTFNLQRALRPGSAMYCLMGMQGDVVVATHTDWLPILNEPNAVDSN